MRREILVNSRGISFLLRVLCINSTKHIDVQVDKFFKYILDDRSILPKVFLKKAVC